jgi:GNAT superfamily N-acetyltransferase
LFVLDKVKKFSITTKCDCGNQDLNEFFHKDAVYYKEDLLAETYALYLKSKGARSLGPLAFVALANDTIKLSKSLKRKLISHKKRYIEEYPAVKIARLGVHKESQRKGLGTHLINLLKALFTTNNRTGCRFLTIDAYNRKEVLRFYKKMNLTSCTMKTKKSPQESCFMT